MVSLLHDRTHPGLTLLPGESILSASYTPLTAPSRTPSALRTLATLCGVDRTTLIGANGPANAATASAPNAANPHARLFETLFGRDSLIVTKLVGHRYPTLARATVLRLAALQGLVWHTAREEEPGRIVHEYRTPDDPVAHALSAERGWAWPYYASVDATPLFVIAAANLVAADPSFAHEIVLQRDGRPVALIESIAAAVGWITNRLASSPSGLIESTTPLSAGIANQVWKDSGDAYFHADGSLATGGSVASIEVVGLTFDALTSAADLALGYPGVAWPGTAAGLRARASEVADTLVRFVEVTPSGAFLALALDRDSAGRGRRCAVRASNPGWLLSSRILDGRPELARIVIDQITDPGMLCAAGIRTLHEGAARFRPGAYHNGSSWPFDTAIIAAGLARHGQAQAAAGLRASVLGACAQVRMFPEFFRGESGELATVSQWAVDIYDPAMGGTNRVEQSPQELQAWTVAATLAMKLALV